MNLNLCPSMMCANYANLENEMRTLEEAGTDIFHLDIMDGRFVPNFAMGMQDILYICKNTSAKTELHLMIEKPGNFIEKFAQTGADIIYIHPESDYHPMTTLQCIREFGMEAGIVLNPGTSVESILELLHVVHRVLVMGVNPGQAGQLYIPYVERKIDKLLRVRTEHKFVIGMDGACTKERIKHLSQKGVENFVLGTAALFYEGVEYKSRFKELRDN